MRNSTSVRSCFSGRFGIYAARPLPLTLSIAFLVFRLLFTPALSAQYEAAKWTVSDGLPDNEVRGLAQTLDGYLWIATLNGLARFDGIRFSVFTKANSKGMVSNRLTSLYLSSSGDLWAPYENRGLLRLHQGSFHTYSQRDGINDGVVSAVMGDDTGQIWIVSDRKIQKWDQARDRFENVTALNQRAYSPMELTSGARAYDGEHAYCFTKGVLLTYLLPSRIQKAGIRAIGVDQAQVAWVETNSGQRSRLAPGGPVISREPSREDRVAFRGSGGQHWNLKLGPELKPSIDVSIGGIQLTVTSDHVLADQQGNLWVGAVGGLYRIQSKFIDVYTVEQGLLDRDVYAVYQDRAGSVWLGTWHKGLTRFRGGKFQGYTTANGLPYPLVTALLEDKNGRLWIGTHGGMIIFVNGRFHPPPVPRLSELVQAIYQDRDGVMWFGMRSGLIRWRGYGPLEEIGAPGEYLDIHVIAQSLDGDLWFGGSTGLTQVHDGTITHWTEEKGLTSNDIWSLYSESDGTLWIGTYDGGMLRLKDGKLTRITKENGLLSDSVFQILDDGQGNLWISCDRGIYRLSKRDLVEFANGTRTSVSSLSFGTSDGLLNLRCNGGSMPAGVRTRDGKLWFPTQDGVAVIDPSRMPQIPAPPHVVVESALLDQTSVPTNTAVRVPPYRDNLEIRYTAPSFNKSEQIRFRYRLEGLDRDWVEARQRRTAFYSHIPPGSYRFKVSAANAGGDWGPETNGLSIKVMAPFYRTLWFETLVVLAIATIIASTWRRRIAQLRIAQAQQLNFLQQLIASQESERKRIATELHDSLGQRLVVINAVAQLSLRSHKGQAQTSDAAALEEIREEAKAAIEDTHSISYNLRPVHLDRFGLTKAVAILVKDVSSSARIPISTQLDSVDDLLPEDQRINFYRIVQEGLTNMIKYSSATSADVRIERRPEKTILVIKDNGVGFETEGNLNRKGESGLGLRGMSERATLMGGSFTVVSAPGCGTALTIELPGCVHQA